MARRARWSTIENSLVRQRFEVVRHRGVSILCAQIRGCCDNSADGVSAVRDALDAIPEALREAPLVSTLELAQFANASDDACEILTSVFAGTPCCWVYRSPDEQEDHRRWDLPPRERLASTLDEALDRVVRWTMDGGFSITYSSGAEIERVRWTERGCLVRNPGGDDWRTEDLYFRNRLVERRIADERDTVVRQPVFDATGAHTDATRAGASLVYRDGRVAECDFSPWQTRAPLPDDWVARIEPFEAIETLRFGRAQPSTNDLLVALGAHPTIHTVELWRESASAIDLEPVRARGVRVRAL
ncbi:MAG: hypothetical protein JNK05_31135 [Myxococcales bacterium]|nr:hypothetical protein [Myxococcales bacterium]